MMFEQDQKRVLKALKKFPEGLSINAIVLEIEAGLISWMAAKKALLKLQEKDKVKKILGRGHTRTLWVIQNGTK